MKNKRYQIAQNCHEVNITQQKKINTSLIIGEPVTKCFVVEYLCISGFSYSTDHFSMLYFRQNYKQNIVYVNQFSIVYIRGY